jgi:hypothetical protein
MKGSIAEKEKNIAVLGLKNFWGEGMYTYMCLYILMHIYLYLQVFTYAYVFIDIYEYVYISR